MASLPAQDPAPIHYLGRRVARTMSFHGADWLTRPEREREEHASVLLEALGIKQGWTVADLGCGNGFHTLPMAKQVGQHGRVLAVDIQPEMLELLDRRARGAEVSDRITGILATATDPKLPPGSLDLLIMVDVYHEISHPRQVLAHIRRALKPKGRAVWVEYRTEDIDVPIKHEHKMSKAQVVREATSNGFQLVRSFDALPWQHVLFFERDDGWKPRPREVPRAAKTGSIRRGPASVIADVKTGTMIFDPGERAPVHLAITALRGDRGTTPGAPIETVEATGATTQGSGRVSLEYRTKSGDRLRLTCAFTGPDGIDVIARSEGPGQGVAPDAQTIVVSIKGAPINDAALHRVGVNRGRRNAGENWSVQPPPTDAARWYGSSGARSLGWPLFGRGAEDGVAVFFERRTAGHGLSVLHAADRVMILGTRTRPERRRPFAFRFHVARPRSNGHADLIARYERWSGEMFK